MLQPSEWNRIQPLVEKLGAVPPPQIAEAGLAHAAIAEDESGQILGVLFLQLAWHLEPLVIDPKERSRVSFKALAETLDHYIEGTTLGPTEYYVFSPDKRVGAMAKLHGMAQKPWRVWYKKLMGNAQEKVA
jgi:hypothetical protein